MSVAKVLPCHLSFLRKVTRAKESSPIGQLLKPQKPRIFFFRKEHALRKPVSILDGFDCNCGHTLVEHNKIRNTFRTVGRGSCRKCKCKRFTPLSATMEKSKVIQKKLEVSVHE